MMGEGQDRKDGQAADPVCLKQARVDLGLAVENLMGREKGGECLTDKTGR